MPHRLTISALSEKLSRREVSAREVTQACLDRVSSVDGQVKAFLSVDAADALAQADAADRALAEGAGSSRPLLGSRSPSRMSFPCRGTR